MLQGWRYADPRGFARKIVIPSRKSQIQYHSARRSSKLICVFNRSLDVLALCPQGFSRRLGFLIKTTNSLANLSPAL
jgi:hypothetical protein